MPRSDWSLKGWHKGPVTLQQAFGIKKGKVQFQPLSASLPAQASAASTSQSGARGGNTPEPSGGTAAQNAALGKAMAAKAGWTGAQWDALNNIVMAESGWDTHAQNPTSGAYGIPQALPGSKMASAGSDWQNSADVQIAWLLGYIRSRYGNPVNAWNFHLAHGWY